MDTDQENQRAKWERELEAAQIRGDKDAQSEAERELAALSGAKGAEKRPRASAVKETR